MVVDDSRFVLTMLTMILRALKVGKIMAHADASEVIADMKVLSKNASARALVPDIIICDWIMSPITGDMLLRWLRLSEDSPDRFIPFVMISGAADSEKVRISRNLGVTEFLAKPFSVAAVCDHLIAAIESPRPFLYTRDYFGPDRRRQRRPWSDVDRRVATADDIEYIYSASTMSKLKPSAKAFIFRLPNRLREKVAGLGRPDRDPAGSHAGGGTTTRPHGRRLQRLGSRLDEAAGRGPRQGAGSKLQGARRAGDCH
jgi:CheY-like chemotaxis protein